MTYGRQKIHMGWNCEERVLLGRTNNRQDTTGHGYRVRRLKWARARQDHDRENVQGGVEGRGGRRADERAVRAQLRAGSRQSKGG